MAADDTSKLIHGILMGTAWLVLAPIAIGASLVRRVLPSTSFCNQNGFWFQIHYYCQIMVVCLTLSGFLVIWLGEGVGDDRRRRFLKDFEDEWESPDVDDDAESEDSESSDGMLFPAFGWTYENAEENIHPKLGVSIVALAVFQAILGFIRPHVHSHPPADEDASNASNSVGNASEDGDANETAVKSASAACMDDTSPGSTLGGAGSVHEEDRIGQDKQHQDPHPPAKTTIRVIWEWCHRCLGLSLLAASLLQCTIGIKIFREDD
jgi:hypothetical protein